MKIERILVPTDFTRGSHAVLKRAIDVAREHDSEIVLVHVIEPLPYGVGRWTEPTQTLEHCAEPLEPSSTGSRTLRSASIRNAPANSTSEFSTRSSRSLHES